MKNFKGRTALVTGAGSGMGRAIALALVDKGCAVALVDVNSTGLEETASLISAAGGSCTQHVVNVANRQAMEALATEIEQTHKQLHILVNIAGVAIQGFLEEQNLEDIERMVAINVMGVVNGCKVFLPLLKQQDEAHIVNMSSALGIMPSPGTSTYSMTKYAITGFSASIRYELDRDNIGVTSAHPGLVSTNFNENTTYADETAKQSSAEILAKRGHSPDKVAAKVIRAIENNKQRVLIGPETYIGDVMKRLMPVWADKLVSKVTLAAAKPD